MKTEPRIDQAELTPCRLCGGKMEVRQAGQTIIIRCTGKINVHDGCGLRFERRGTWADVAAIWNKGC